MPDHEVDVLVIGAGTAGLAAYRAAREHTDRLALVEGGQYGTTCARSGCMPSKLLIAAADAAHAVRTASTFGVRAASPEIDGPAVMARLHHYRDEFVQSVLEVVEGMPAAHKLSGQARFLAPRRVEVGGVGTVEAKRVVIATGSVPMIVDDVREAASRLITSDELFEMSDLPASVALFGAGVVGLELAQALDRLGVRVRLFGVGGMVGPLTDPEVVAAATTILRDAYPFDPDAEVQRVEERDGGVAVTFVDAGQTRTEQFDYLLAATGRKPALDGLDLARAGLELDDQGVPLFDRTTCQCGASPVFIAGDAGGKLPVLHEAADDGKVAGDNAGRFPDVRVRPRRPPLTVLFSRPEIALVGRTFRELDDAGVRFECGGVDFTDQGRAKVTGRAAGLLRIYGEVGSGRVLGAELAAPDGEHLAHLLAFAVQQNLTAPEMLELPLYHPTLEEGLRTALRELVYRLRMGPEPIARCLDCGPGA